MRVNLKADLLLAKGDYGPTAWQYAAINGTTGILETLWRWGEKCK